MSDEGFFEFLKDEIKENDKGKSYNFLKWFLINYYAVDEDKVDDYICDGHGDQGIDAIFVDEQTEEIFLFQGKFKENFGDERETEIARFVGSKSPFENKENIENLLQGTGNDLLKNLVKDLELEEKVGNYGLKLIFLSNGKKNRQIEELIGHNKNLEFYGIERLNEEYVELNDGDFDEDIELEIEESKIMVPVEDKIFVLSLKVKTILEKFKGIDDMRLFSKNVRYGLGKGTRVNKEITNTLSDPEDKKNVLAYHNGITLVCGGIEVEGNVLKLKNYSVVNGCQSILSFYRNKDKINEDVEILVKIIKAEEEFSNNITKYTNTQNPVQVRDLKSNNTFQKKLQKEFEDFEIFYEIKRGEPNPDGVSNNGVLKNDFVAQLISSFHLGMPHISHEKTKLFNDHYQEIFSSKINAPFVLIMNEIYNSIDTDEIEQENMKTYKPVKFFILWVLGELLKQDDEGKKIFSNPIEFYDEHKDNLRDIFDKIYGLFIPGFNAEIEEIEKCLRDEGKIFDYKNMFRNKEELDKIKKSLVKEYKRAIVRHEGDKIENIINEASQE